MSLRDALHSPLPWITLGALLALTIAAWAGRPKDASADVAALRARVDTMCIVNAELLTRVRWITTDTVPADYHLLRRLLTCPE